MRPNRGTAIALLITATMMLPATASCGMPLTPEEAAERKTHVMETEKLIRVCAEPQLEEQLDDSDGSWMNDRVKAWRSQEARAKFMPRMTTQEVFADFLERQSASGLPGIRVDRERCAEATLRSPAVHSNIMFTDDEVEDLSPR